MISLFQVGGAVFSVDVSAILIGILITLVAWLGKGKFERIDDDMKGMGQKIEKSRAEGKIDLEAVRKELRNEIASEFYSLRSMLPKRKDDAQSA